MTTKQRQRLVAIELNQDKKLDFIAKTIGTSELYKARKKKDKVNMFWFASWRKKISFEDVQFSSMSPKVFIEMQLYDDNTIFLRVKSEGLPQQYKELDLLKDFHLTRENLYYNVMIKDRYEREKRANHVRIAYSYINEVVWEKIVDMLNNVPNFWNYEVIQEVQASAQMLHF